MTSSHWSPEAVRGCGTAPSRHSRQDSADVSTIRGARRTDKFTLAHPMTASRPSRDSAVTFLRDSGRALTHPER